MPRYNVKLPDGRWQVYSSIVDDFITDPMTLEELGEFRRREAVRQADEETASLLTDRPKVNVMSYEEAMELIEIVHGDDEDEDME